MVGAWFSRTTKTYWGITGIVLGVTLFSFTTFVSWHHRDLQNFVYQARGFIHGQLHYLEPPASLTDSVIRGDKIYWSLAPLPALALVPMVLIREDVPWQSYTQWIIVAAILGLAYQLSRQHGFPERDSIWLALAFVFGSVIFGVAVKPHPWQFATALSTLAALVALVEFLGKKRFWLIGIAAACAFASRFTAGLIVIPILAELLLSPTLKIPKKAVSLACLIIPILITGIGLLWFNHARFGDVLNNGYYEALISPPSQVANRAHYGLFQLQNIPSNFYYYFLAAPAAIINPDTLHLVPHYMEVGIGLGFWFVAPFFLYLWRARLETRWQKLVGISAAALTILLLSYYSLTYFHLGVYYLADVLPLYFLLALSSFARPVLGTRHYLLITFSLCFNLYLLLASL